MEFLNDIRNAFLPELIITIFIFINVILSLFFNKRFYKTSQWIALFGILMSFASIGFIQAEPTYSAFSNAFVSNVYTVLFKILILVGVFFTVLLSHKVVKRRRTRAFEYFALMFASSLGAMLLVSANDFLSAFVSLELLIISCCFMLGLLKNYKAKEGAFKYFIGSTVASSVFLLGVSYVYGICGSLNFDTVSQLLENYPGSMLFSLSLVLVVLGIMFKLCVMPFAFWVADAFKGASTSICCFVSIVPVVAAYGLFSRLLVLMGKYVPILGLIIILMSLLSMFYGAYGMLRQTDIKRFMGYSVVLQSGFILLVLGVITPYSVAGMIYYLICYMFMSIAIWAGITMFVNATGRDDMGAYVGIAYKNPFYTTTMILILMAFAGLPPTSGFIAKFFVLSAIARLGFVYIIFLLIALLLSTVAICAYFKPIKIMFEKNADTLTLVNKMVFSKIVFYFSTTITVLLCFYSGTIIEFCELIAYSL